MDNAKRRAANLVRPCASDTNSGGNFGSGAATIYNMEQVYSRQSESDAATAAM